MDDASLKRIAALLGGVVACGFCLYKAFCGLVLGHVTLVTGDQGFLGAGLRTDGHDGITARVVGLMALLLGAGVAYATIRSLRETS